MAKEFQMHKLIHYKIFTEMETNQIYYSHIQSTKIKTIKFKMTHIGHKSLTKIK